MPFDDRIPERIPECDTKGGEARRLTGNKRGVREPHRVAAVVYDQLCLFEYGIVVEVFGLPRPVLQSELESELRPWYRFDTVSIDPAPLATTGGVQVAASEDLGLIDRADTVLVPGWRDLEEEPPERLIARLRAAAERGARLVSVCSGVFVLAAAGLLDGKRATTHWRYAEELARRYPRIDVDPSVLYVNSTADESGGLLTSAGSAAGIDLCLHVVRSDFGPEVANRVARRLVVAPHRDGGQAQFVERPVDCEDGTSFSILLDWVRERLDEPHTIAGMAARAHTSPRTLIRRFRRALGVTPHEWLTQERIRVACELLESGDGTIEEVAASAGFGSGQLLRHHFRRQVGLTPTAYRRRFARGLAN